jgi:ABC-type multidrug transport system permease subunit
VAATRTNHNSVGTIAVAPTRTGGSVSDWPVAVLVRTRLTEFIRKPAAVFWTYVFPLVMMFILGSAFRSQTNPPSEIGVVADSPATPWLQQLAASPELKVSHLSPAVGLNHLRSGRISLLVRPNPGATEGLEFLYDPARGGGRLAELQIREQLRASREAIEPLPIVTTPYSEPGGRYIDFLIPGLIGMTLLGGGLWGVGYAIVDMRIRKLLKRYLATPMRRSDFLLGIVLSRLLFMFPQVAMILLASYWAFSVKIHGSWIEFAGLVTVGGLQFAGVGLLVASRARSMEAMSGLINLAMLPMWTLSGIFFSYQNFPEILHWPIRLLPLTSLLDVLRGVMLDGASCWSFPIELILIAAWTTGTFSLALYLFRWSD